MLGKAAAAAVASGMNSKCSASWSSVLADSIL
jgi:hypothetical protein